MPCWRRRKKVVGYNGSGSETYGRKAIRKTCGWSWEIMERGRASAKIARGKKHKAGEIKRIRGLLKSGPCCLSITSRRRDTRLDGRFFCVFGYLREQPRETQYLRLIGNGASLIRDIISSGKLPSSIAGTTFRQREREARKKRNRLSRRWYAPDKTSGIRRRRAFSSRRYRSPKWRGIFSNVRMLKRERSVSMIGPRWEW